MEDNRINQNGSVRKALSELSMYVKQVTQWRIYESKNLGYGLKNCRDEYGKEFVNVSKVRLMKKN